MLRRGRVTRVVPAWAWQRPWVSGARFPAAANPLSDLARSIRHFETPDSCGACRLAARTEEPERPRARAPRQSRRASAPCLRPNCRERRWHPANPWRPWVRTALLRYSKIPDGSRPRQFLVWAPAVELGGRAKEPRGAAGEGVPVPRDQWRSGSAEIPCRY